MREAGHLNIGPLRWTLRLDGDGAVDCTDPAYGGFFSPAPAVGDSHPLWTLPTDLVRRPVTDPPGEPLWRAGENWAVWEAGADLVFRSGFDSGGRTRVECRVARDLSRATVAWEPAGGADPAGVESPLRYPLDQFLAWGMLSRIGGALLHASAAVRNGQAWVFAGPSGAGKSTLAGLCQAAGFRILNDDRVLVFRRGGEWRVAGTPWHGTGRQVAAADAPLAGLFFLRQAGADHVEEIEAPAARLALLDVAAVPWFEDRWAQDTLDGLEGLLQAVPLGRFHFTRTPAAVRALADFQPAEPEVCA